MTSYDPQFLRSEYLSGLRVPKSVDWIAVIDIPPTPFTEVLITGPTHKHAVGYLDCSSGGWVVGDKRVGFEDYPHWMPLPIPPFYG
jgi:hypothetical protein